MKIRKKYRDGALASIIEKLKRYFVDLKARFGRLRPVSKILFVLAKIAKLFSLANAATSIPMIKRLIGEIKLKKAGLEALANPVLTEVDEQLGFDTSRASNEATVSALGVDISATKLSLEIKACISVISFGLGMLFDKVSSIMSMSAGRKDSMWHQDGLLDGVMGKLNQLYEKTKRTFQSLPIGKKILFLITKAIKLVSVASISIDLTTLVGVKTKLSRIQAIIRGASYVLPIKPIKSLAEAAVDRFNAGTTIHVLIRLFGGALGMAIAIITEKIAKLEGK